MVTTSRHVTSQTSSTSSSGSDGFVLFYFVSFWCSLDLVHTGSFSSISVGCWRLRYCKRNWFGRRSRMSWLYHEIWTLCSSNWTRVLIGLAGQRPYRRSLPRYTMSYRGPIASFTQEYRNVTASTPFTVRENI